jgi:hypothetical protein
MRSKKASAYKKKLILEQLRRPSAWQPLTRQLVFQPQVYLSATGRRAAYSSQENRRKFSPSSAHPKAQPWKIMSIARRDWAAAGHSI